jgi:hypothetical protein
MTWEGVTMPSAIRRMTITTRAIPILMALLIITPTMNPRTRGTKTATTNVVLRSGGRKLTTEAVSQLAL